MSYSMVQRWGRLFTFGNGRENVRVDEMIFGEWTSGTNSSGESQRKPTLQHFLITSRKFRFHRFARSCFRNWIFGNWQQVGSQKSVKIQKDIFHTEDHVHSRLAQRALEFFDKSSAGLSPAPSYTNKIAPFDARLHLMQDCAIWSRIKDARCL